MNTFTSLSTRGPLLRRPPTGLVSSAHSEGSAELGLRGSLPRVFPIPRSQGTQQEPKPVRPCVPIILH